jgi:hypothetical protein
MPSVQPRRPPPLQDVSASHASPGFAVFFFVHVFVASAHVSHDAHASDDVQGAPSARRAAHVFVVAQ